MGRDGQVSISPSTEQSPMTALRVAVVGQGLIGRQRAEALLGIPGARLVATVDPCANTSLRPFIPHHACLNDLSVESYDAAVIAVPHDIAGKLAAMSLRAGKPILLEKPLGLTASEAHELEQLADAVPTPSFVGYNYRYLPTIRELISIVERGRLGELRSIDMLIGHGGHPRSAEGWKLNAARAGGGVLLDPGVHLLDILLRIAPKASCCAAEATRGFWPTGIEEDVTLTFRTERLLASVRVSHIRWINTFRIEVFGEEGYAIAEGRGGNYGPMTIRVGKRWGWFEHEGMGQRETEDVSDFGNRDESLHEELVAVIAAWQTGSPSADALHPATMAEARAVSDLCDRLYARIH